MLWIPFRNVSSCFHQCVEAVKDLTKVLAFSLKSFHTTLDVFYESVYRHCAGLALLFWVIVDDTLLVRGWRLDHILDESLRVLCHFFLELEHFSSDLPTIAKRLYCIVLLLQWICTAGLAMFHSGAGFTDQKVCNGPHTRAEGYEHLGKPFHGCITVQMNRYMGVFRLSNGVLAEHVHL